LNPEERAMGADHPASILAVDDTAANLQVLAGMLKERGYKVRPVPNGKLALLAARRDPPDLILLDINMPEMNGYEVCERLKADPKLKEIPVIYISALTEQLDKVRAFATGGVDYLTKPFQMEELHARVETHLKLRRLQIVLEETNARLAKANARMSGDLKAAATIQETFRPREVPRVPGADFAWIYRPSDKLGGDGLNVIPLGDGMVGLFILDVSGHGVASALMSVTLSRLLSPPSEPSSILVRARDVGGRSDITPPAEVADRLNRLFPFDSAPDKCATMVYGVLNTATGEFRYACAGHSGLVHLPSGAAPVILKSQEFAIGLADDAYKERSVLLGAGDRLYLCSDGVPETMDRAGEPFGDARLLEAIGRGRSESLQEDVAALLGEIARWHGFVKFQDDITILAVEALTAGSVASVGDDSGLPLQFSLRPSSPNPFLENTSVRYSLPREGLITAGVFDANDQLVRSLLKAKVPAGSHDIVWDGRIDSGSRAAGGTYFLRLRAGADSGTTRMTLLR
jgi:sigma-B regulation protein RsbU (phosphoserine phosphatase)